VLLFLLAGRKFFALLPHFLPLIELSLAVFCHN